jgi:hypothetical protein
MQLCLSDRNRLNGRCDDALDAHTQFLRFVFS